MADIAALAGVGIATVDRVLTGRRKVREENARRVYEAASKLGYHATPVIRYRLSQTAPPMTFGFILPKQKQPFYKRLSAALEDAVALRTDVRGRAIVRYAQTQTPQEHAELMMGFVGTADVIAASVVNHPLVTKAARELSAEEVPVVSMLNDFAKEERRRFVGIDNYRAGRLAGWMLAGLSRTPGTIAVLVGGNLWQAHQLRESGLRSYVREHAPDFALRDAVLTLETNTVTHDLIQDVLETWRDLRGVYITGGGVEGAIEALRSSNRSDLPHVVAHSSSDMARLALSERQLSMLIETPVDALARAVVDELVEAVHSTKKPTGSERLLRPEVVLPESL